MTELAHHIDNFAEYLRAERGASPETIRAYTSDLGQLTEWLVDRGLGDIEAGSVASEHLRGFVAARFDENQASSIARKISSIRSFFRFLRKKGVISASPADVLQTPKVRIPLKNYLNVDEVFMLLDGARPEGPLGAVPQTAHPGLGPSARALRREPPGQRERPCAGIHPAQPDRADRGARGR